MTKTSGQKSSYQKIAVGCFVDEGKLVDFGDDSEGQGRTEDILEVAEGMMKDVEHVQYRHLEQKLIH